VQELLRIPIRRPKLLAVLKADDPKRIGVASLAAFNDRLWRMTSVPLRYFQEVAFWLFQHTAALELQDNGPRAGEECKGGLAQKLGLLKGLRATAGSVDACPC
jgi:hypothetical protein